ncbi:LLM class flavin-dependent oxidoreductase [Amycolatopsis azurea]|uniref:Luciferase family oxidoreductase n=1 Tax=Amycolatopsis azurea DSM 43854 TaxID=1238180 RepID=M2QLS0_9PSEU|nr:LLM class flavin-dependent oxidoreductase [Amycolatopsis azurea]EMD26797.1 putative monooxygenase with luciferase-like ATPase activity [Amycolatopsis azurea DSM 43854]OOC00539.1 luciferase family oxidoreductase [Amycolatopsis azurea DSM 43854]
MATAAALPALSVLDTSPIVQGSTPRQALLNTVDLARLAEDLGYHRYWVPEHHGMRGVASSAPAVLIAHLANATRHLRIGAGGVLLPNHAPLVVAEQFGTLAALHPGRIDLGIGRAPGGSKAASAALSPQRTKAFSTQLDELRDYLNPREDADVKAVPVLGGNVPELWLLGRSPESAALAAERGILYAFAHHLAPAAPLKADLVSVSVIAAEDDERAEWLAGSTRLKVLSRIRGNRIQLPSPEEAANFPYTADDRAENAKRSDAVLTGSPDTLKPKLQTILDETGAAEIMVTTPLFHHADRRRSYELLASLAGGLIACTNRSASSRA